MQFKAFEAKSLRAHTPESVFGLNVVSSDAPEQHTYTQFGERLAISGDIERHCRIWSGRCEEAAGRAASKSREIHGYIAWHTRPFCGGHTMAALETRSLHTEKRKRERDIWSIPNLIFLLLCFVCAFAIIVRMILILHCQKTTWEAFLRFAFLSVSLWLQFTLRPFCRASNRIRRPAIA